MVAGNPTITHNLFWQNGTDVDGDVTVLDSIVADPLFVIPPVRGHQDTFDVHLQVYSPAIDAGDPAILDKDGTRSDIGAFGGPNGESYPYTDFPPLPPSYIVATLSSTPEGIKLTWAKNDEIDFYKYRLYKSETSGNLSSPGNLLAELDENSYIDTVFDYNKTYYYTVTVIDYAGNESLPAAETQISVTGVEVTSNTIYTYKLMQNYPNPFNPSTQITYTLKENSFVKLGIYSVAGELIQQLVYKEQDKGFYTVNFNANGLASGLYLYKIEVKDMDGTPVFAKMKKMILVK